MAAITPFRVARKLLSTRWLTEGEGELVGYALDLLRDGILERLRLSVLARIPQNDPTGTTTAPTDALAAMGRDRRVIRGISESNAAYAVRLKAWLDDRRTAGNPFALMQKLAEYCGPLCSFRTVDVAGNWFSRDENGVETVALKTGNWNWDGDATRARWSRFWVIIYPNGLWTEGPEWGDPDAPEWGSTSATWGSTATAAEVAAVRSIVADWKPAGTRCVNVIVAFDTASFDPASPEPDGLWETWGKVVDGVMVPARLETARYWDGV